MFIFQEIPPESNVSTSVMPLVVFRCGRDMQCLISQTCAAAIRPRSLIKTILAGSGTLVQGSELETVGVEISDYNLEGTATKFYDLAGQVDYYGLHQLFVTERTVYVMTWDASKFLRRKEVNHEKFESTEDGPNHP